jgi:alkyl hydroperoxide reductase subunit F
VDLMNTQRAVKLSADGLVNVELANGATLRSKTVLIATGARWREMNVPGEKEYRGRGVAYCPHCDGPLFKGKRVAVIGGGNSGVEAAIDLAGIVEHVTLIEFDSQLRADAVLQTKLRSLPNVTVDRLGADHRSAWRRPEDDRPQLHRPRQRRMNHKLDLAGRVRADRPAAQHRLAERHAGAESARRN